MAASKAESRNLESVGARRGGSVRTPAPDYIVPYIIASTSNRIFWAPLHLQIDMSLKTIQLSCDRNLCVYVMFDKPNNSISV